MLLTYTDFQLMRKRRSMGTIKEKNRAEQVSDEATKKGLDLAKEQGDIYRKTMKYMVTEVAHGEIKREGDIEIGYAVENAEGLYYPIHNDFEWQEPEEHNAHIEIAVCDARDGRFIPGLTVIVTLTDPSGKVIGTHQQPFLWHPWLYHYGLNWAVPMEGKYRLHVQILPPLYPRHDKKNGQFFTQPVEVVFENVHIQPGQKK
jgi:hypothetical protein